MNEKPKCIEDSDGSKDWLLNGKWHREDGPAIEWSDGTKAWYINGKWHREDGPAIEWSDGQKAWFLDGEEYSLERWNDITKFYTDEEIVLIKLRDG